MSLIVYLSHFVFLEIALLFSHVCCINAIVEEAKKKMWHV